MGSAAPGLILEESTLQDCRCLPPPSYKSVKPAMPPRSLVDPAPGSSLLSLEITQLEAPPAMSTACNCSSKQVKVESDDEADQRPGRLSVAIGERISTLQHLLPQGLELEEEEVFKVAKEYVKELERQIQVFHSTTTEIWAKHEPSMSDSPLRRRGLCIVPLSTLAKAL